MLSAWAQRVRGVATSDNAHFALCYASKGSDRELTYIKTSPNPIFSILKFPITPELPTAIPKTPPLPPCPQFRSSDSLYYYQPENKNHVCRLSETQGDRTGLSRQEIKTRKKHHIFLLHPILRIQKKPLRVRCADCPCRR